jgi:hypothetical protein
MTYSPAMLDLDAIREIVAPLDLSPVFAVVAGSHLAGTAAPDSDVVVRGAHAKALTASLGPGRRTATVELELLDRGVSLRYASEDLDRVARRVAKGDGALLESLRSGEVLSGEEALGELREISRAYVTRRIHRYYRALVRRAFWRLEGSVTKRVRPVLSLYRALLAGIHVLERGEIVPDLRELVGIFAVPWLEGLLRSPKRSARIGDPARTRFLLGEAHALLERMERACEETSLPAELPPPDAALAFAAARRVSG